MNIYTWTNFSKKKNSTKQPTSGTLKTVVLKEDCSIDRPSFILNEPISNITYVQAFGTYYFVTDIINLNAHQCIIECTKDVLATYKTDIGNYTAFIERCVTGYDQMITDNYLTQSNNITNMKTITVSMPTTNGDVYVVPVFGRGGVLNYVFPSLDDASIFFSSGSTITVDGDSVTQSDWWNALKNAGWSFVGSDVTSYMGDISFTPYMPAIANPYVGTNTIKFGFTEFTFTPPTPGEYVMHVMNPDAYYYDFDVTLTDPGNSYANTDFRAYDPRYSQYKIYLPGCGVYDINSADAGKRDLHCHVFMDFLTMAVTYYIYHDSGSQVAMFEGKFGCGVPAVGSKMDVFGILSDTNKGAASMMSENFSAAAGSVISSAQKVFEPQINARSAGAGNGSLIKEFPNILYSVKNFGSKDFPNVVAGRPRYQNVTISTCSGYIKCGNASVAISGEDADRDAINNYLNTGFYYE